jgi:hypothetical protein
MPIVQVSPEIRELMSQLHLDLRTLEAAQLGAPWPETHRHSRIGAVRQPCSQREILPPYVVEFEDGQYAVRAVGANHNLLYVKIANQVSLLVSLSAGLVSQAELVAGQAALAAAQATLEDMLREVQLIHGLELGSPMTVSPTSRVAGTVSQTITQVGPNVTVTRDP